MDGMNVCVDYICVKHRIDGVNVGIIRFASNITIFWGGKGDSSLFRSFFPPRWHSDEKKNEKKLAQASRSEEKCYALKSETHKKDHYFPSCFIGEPFRFRLRRKWKKLWKVLIILLGLVHYYYSKSTNLEHYYQFGHITIQIVPQLSN